MNDYASLARRDAEGGCSRPQRQPALDQTDQLVAPR
jgi:hypothetical protein